ncbi:multicopper oxidase domain-containing protein, partial [Georgenia sp. 10Sc9-8]|nr:multicopper oxidase domain-containing protein [Georgenia halotolerans]
MRFEDYADPDTPYMYHCHFLRHEDGGLMGQFLVLDEGMAPGMPVGGHEDH